MEYSDANTNESHLNVQIDDLLSGFDNLNNNIDVNEGEYDPTSGSTEIQPARPPIAYASVKKIGNKLKEEKLFAKIISISTLAADVMHLNQATDYWFVIYQSNVQLKVLPQVNKDNVKVISKEHRSIRYQGYSGTCTFYRIHFPRQTATYQFHWTCNTVLFRIMTISISKKEVQEEGANSPPRTPKEVISDVVYANDDMLPSNVNLTVQKPPTSYMNLVVLVPNEEVYGIVWSTLQAMNFHNSTTYNKLSLWSKAGPNLQRKILLICYDTFSPEEIDALRDATEVLLFIQRDQDEDNQHSIVTIKAVESLESRIDFACKAIDADAITTITLRKIARRAKPILTQLNELMQRNKQVVVGCTLLRNNQLNAEDIRLFVESWISAWRGITTDSNYYCFEYINNQPPALPAYGTIQGLANRQVHAQLAAVGYSSVKVFVKMSKAFNWFLKWNYKALQRSIKKEGFPLVSITQACPEQVTAMLTLQENEPFRDELLDLLHNMVQQHEVDPNRDIVQGQWALLDSPLSGHNVQEPRIYRQAREVRLPAIREPVRRRRNDGVTVPAEGTEHTSINSVVSQPEPVASHTSLSLSSSAEDPKKSTAEGETPDDKQVPYQFLRVHVLHEYLANDLHMEEEITKTRKNTKEIRKQLVSAAEKCSFSLTKQSKRKFVLGSAQKRVKFEVTIRKSYEDFGGVKVKFNYLYSKRIEGGGYRLQKELGIFKQNLDL